MELNKNIKGEKLQKMFNYLNRIADRVSIERYCSERIPDDEFAAVQAEFKNHLLENDKKRRNDYASDRENYRARLRRYLGIKTEQEATKYFDTLLNQDMEILECVKNDGKIREVAPIEEDVIRKRYTRITPTTSGPIMQQYYIRVGELLKRIESDMDSLFAFPYTINNEQYENLAFYRGKDPIFTICSHEKFACIMLNEKEQKELQKLGTPLEEDELEI